MVGSACRAPLRARNAASPGLAAPGLGFDPLVPATPAECTRIDPPDRDSDEDGLTDCEESVLRTDPSLVDTDKDGLPDLIEARRGGNPLVDDLLVDSDRDGIPNGQAIRVGLTANGGDANAELEYGYRYRFVDEGVRTQLEAVPRDPLPGVVVTAIDGSTSFVGLLNYDPGPPATLTFADDARAGAPGVALDVSRGGALKIQAADGPNGVGRVLSIRVTSSALVIRTPHGCGDRSTA